MTGRDLLTLNLVERPHLGTKPQENQATSWDAWEAFRGSSDLFSDPDDRSRPSRARCLAVSLAFQALVVGALLVHSVTSESELPAPQVVKTFLAVAPPAPAPPRAPQPASLTPAPPQSAAVVGTRPVMRVPELIPSSMPVVHVDMDVAALGDDGFGDTTSVAGGVPGGVIGGLVGGLGEAPAPIAPPAEPTIYVVSGDLERPDKLVHVDPVYPGLATFARVEGLVILEATIDGDGNVANLRVLRSVPLLDDAALEAVKNWKYEPTIIGGKPVPIQMTVTVKFALA